MTQNYVVLVNRHHICGFDVCYDEVHRPISIPDKVLGL
jgi:hypothetical protein